MSLQKTNRAGLSRAGMLGALSFLGAWSAHAAVSPVDPNWRQWRGPLGTGVSPTAQPPVSWSEGKNIRWKVKLPGDGTGTPVVWNDRLYVQTAVPAGRAAAAPPAADGSGRPPRTIQPTGPYRFMLLCLDRRTGKTIWQKVAREEVPHEGHHADHGYSSQSAVTDGKHVYAYFGSRGLYAYDLKGNLKWSKNLGRMQTRNGFGEGSTPALHGNTLVVTWDHEGDDFIVALNAATGKELWRQKRDEPTSWATPLIVQHGKQTQVVTAASNRVRSYDLATGKVIWECSGLTGNVIPTPVAANGVVYVTSGFRGSALMAIRLGRTGDLTGTNAILWSHNRATPYVPSPLLYGDRLYFFGSNNGILSCFDVKSGRPILNGERIQALQGVYASPVGAAGRVYLVGRNGATVVIKHADKLEVLATNQLAEGVDASPALAGKDLFVRGREHLYCISEK
ncbi:MAG: PQQ-binding-like beta-propeller repeat protein [Actinomycetota bacterium]